MSDTERGKEVCVGRKVLGSKVELKHYFLNGDTTSTFHTDVADNIVARKLLDRKEMVEVDGKPLTIKELVEKFGKDTVVFLDPDGKTDWAKSRMGASKKYGYNGNGHTVPFLNRKGCRSLDGDKIRG